MRIITQGLNWLIMDHIKDLDPIKKMLSTVTDEDWAAYTSAKGSNSKQHYITNPEWMPSVAHKSPDGWEEIKEWYEHTVGGIIIHHGLMPNKWSKLELYRAWTVKGEEGSYHTLHDHGPNSLCSITYLETPKDQDDRQGQVYFVMQSDPYNQLAPVKHKVVHINPHPGMIIIFPSWLLHGVYPQGPGLRQTLSIDFTGKLNDDFEDTAGYVSIV